MFECSFPSCQRKNFWEIDSRKKWKSKSFFFFLFLLKFSQTYNIYFCPPKVNGLDDITGEPLTQRRDDTPEVVEKRYKTFTEKIQPILNYYKEKNCLYVVDASLHPSEVYSKIKPIIQKYHSKL